jgi:hypothetical protein
MPATAPLRASIRVSPPPRWTGHRLVGTVLAIWSAVAALLVAVLLAIVWDLRS